MNMQLPQGEFDVAEVHPLLYRRAPEPVGNRLTAAAVTIAAHVLVIFALVAGFTVAHAVREPATITVSIEPEARKPQDVPPLPTPQMIKPAMVTAPIPDVKIAASPTAMVAAPPQPAQPVITPVSTATPPPTYTKMTWQGLLLARLEAAKRYPEDARFHHQQGVTSLRFVMDREGRVVSASIDKSSGFDSLDKETLAMIQRAQPLPKPPAEMPGATIELVVPVEFYLHRK